jgi:predicted transcriptional regulator
MERQLTMRLPADLATKLERSAKRLKRKHSEVVREALEQYLDTQPEVHPIERVRDLLGSVASGRLLGPAPSRVPDPPVAPWPLSSCWIPEPS